MNNPRRDETRAMELEDLRSATSVNAQGKQLIERGENKNILSNFGNRTCQRIGKLPDKTRTVAGAREMVDHRGDDVIVDSKWVRTR